MKNFYNEKIEDIYKEFSSGINGLSEEEAQKRLIQNGISQLKQP